MSDIMDITGFEQLVRDRAYALWVSEGRPHGQDVEHWRISEEAVRAELATAAPEKPLAEPKVEPAPVQAAAEPKAEPLLAPAAAPATPKAEPVKAADKPKTAANKKKGAAKAAAPGRAVSATLQ